MSDNGIPIQGRTVPADATFIAGIANRILETLMLMNISTETRQSILTTAFINHTKLMVREASPDTFENDKGVVVSLLETIANEIQKMKPAVPNARQSETSQNPT
jgi:hypothetical protein